MAREVFDIFLSSTSKDLKPYRDKVAEQIDRLRQTAIRMETFGAKPTKPLDACREEVQACDALIVIVGHRYGWIPAKKDGGDGIKSITWWEVEWALEGSKPVYAFLADPAAAWTGEREQDRLTSAKTDTDMIDIGKAVRSLSDFRAFLEGHSTREVFSSPDDLGGKVTSSLHPWLLSQAVDRVRNEYEERLASVPTRQARPVPSQAAHAVDHPHWQEQMHVMSAQRVAGGDARGVRIALIAGRANTDHPALAGATIAQFDARRSVADRKPDDYTTALAAMLVGTGNQGAYRGVAAGARLFIAQAIDASGSALSGDILAGVDAAIREGAQVICLTLGSTHASEGERAVYERAAALGVATVCPAGNDGSNTPIYPGAYESCISAAAVTARNELAVFSNHGPSVTTGAVGVDIPVAVGKVQYQSMSGTSFACAIVAGAAALMLKVNAKLEPAQLKGILRDVGAKAFMPQSSKAAGSLRVLDIYEAVQQAQAATPPRPKGTKRKKKSKRAAGR